MTDPDNSIKRKHYTWMLLSGPCCHLSDWISHWNLQNLNWFSVTSATQELTKRCQEYSSNSAQSQVVVCQGIVRLLSDWLLISGTALSFLQPTRTQPHAHTHLGLYQNKTPTMLLEDLLDAWTPKTTFTSPQKAFEVNSESDCNSVSLSDGSLSCWSRLSTRTLQGN